MKYSEFQPTGVDPKGMCLSGRETWIVCPTIRNRDSGPLERSNFIAALDLLGGESETVEVHRLSRRGCGWLEVIIVDPIGEKSQVVADIKARLEAIPPLDEELLAKMEWDEFCESWDSWAREEFLGLLVSHLDMSEQEAQMARDADLKGIYFEINGGLDFKFSDLDFQTMDVGYVISTIKKDKEEAIRWFT